MLIMSYHNDIYFFFYFLINKTKNDYSLMIKTKKDIFIVFIHALTKLLNNLWKKIV
jgi:hypothetical protein